MEKIIMGQTTYRDFATLGNLRFLLEHGATPGRLYKVLKVFLKKYGSSPDNHARLLFLKYADGNFQLRLIPTSKNP